jgi:hypothetical protein
MRWRETNDLKKKKGEDSLHLRWSKEINRFLEVNKAKYLTSIMDLESYLHTCLVGRCSNIAKVVLHVGKVEMDMMKDHHVQG